MEPICTNLRAMPVAKGESIDTERTRGKLIDAAAGVFYRDGTGAGVNELAQRAGVSKVSLYRHFGSKDGLIEAVLQDRSRHFVAWLRTAAGVPDDPAERVLAVFDALLGWYADADFRGCGIVNAAGESPDPTSAARRVAAEHLERYRTLLTGLARDAGVADPERAGRQLLLLVQGATVVASLGGDPGAAQDARELARLVVA
jgi:AcrR family transcriptional regulator